jgi:recombination protein RecR
LNALEDLQQRLKQLPGLGYRTAERIALHLLVEKPERLPALVAALEAAGRAARRCALCGNLAEEEFCPICADPARNRRQVCVVDDLNLASLFTRMASGEVDEIILALANDVEGEATCHFILQHVRPEHPIKASRIGFGLPSGGGVLYADPATLRSALESRQPV